VLAVIGGTGFAEFSQLENITGSVVSTGYGDVYVEQGELHGQKLVFLPRHGHPPRFPPHRINYRANIDALVKLNVQRVLAVTAVGSVDPSLQVADLVIPDQIIDYTYGREHTFYEDELTHIDLTYPYDSEFRAELIHCAEQLQNVSGVWNGVYGCTQGPRLETAAEIKRLYNDGCTIVGMTAMPEAALARERDLPYAGISFIVNAGAGIEDEPIEMDVIKENLDVGLGRVVQVIGAYLKSS
jgi:5'-methylthioinosine phosphorylase